MRSVINREQVRVDDVGAEAARARPRPARGKESVDHGAPRARLLQLDGGVQALEFTCACGEVSLIEIQCEQKP